MQMANAAHIGERIQQLRMSKGMTQQELATGAGLSWSVVARIEQGKTPNPQYLTLRAIARVLGVGVDDLDPENSS